MDLLPAIRNALESCSTLESCGSLCAGLFRKLPQWNGRLLQCTWEQHKTTSFWTPVHGNSLHAFYVTLKHINFAVMQEYLILFRGEAFQSISCFRRPEQKQLSSQPLIENTILPFLPRIVPPCDISTSMHLSFCLNTVSIATTAA